MMRCFLYRCLLYVFSLDVNWESDDKQWDSVPPFFRSKSKDKWHKKSIVCGQQNCLEKYVLKLLSPYSCSYEMAKLGYCQPQTLFSAWKSERNIDEIGSDLCGFSMWYVITRRWIYAYKHSLLAAKFGMVYVLCSPDDELQVVAYISIYLRIFTCYILRQKSSGSEPSDSSCKNSDWWNPSRKKPDGGAISHGSSQGEILDRKDPCDVPEFAIISSNKA